MLKKLFYFLPLLSVLTACVTTPPVLAVDEGYITSFSEVQARQNSANRDLVRLGGKVINVTALPHSTKLEILSLPISTFSAKPILDGKPEGRFVAYITGFVEPESVKEQYITLLGELSGTEQGKVDEANYTYPVVQVTNYHFWRLVQQYYYDPFDYWYPRPFGFWWEAPLFRVGYSLY